MVGPSRQSLGHSKLAIVEYNAFFRTVWNADSDRRWVCRNVGRSYCQWRNDAPGAPATPGGAVIGGRQIIIL